MINLPLGIFVVAMARRHVPETRDPTASGRLDLPGAVLAALGLAGTTYALIEAPGGMSPLIVLTGVGGVVALVAFLLAERRSPNPMMPLETFSSRQFSAANLVTFVVYAALGGFFFLFVSFLQISLGYSPIEAGVASAARTCPTQYGTNSPRCAHTWPASQRSPVGGSGSVRPAGGGAAAWDASRCSTPN